MLAAGEWNPITAGRELAIGVPYPRPRRPRPGRRRGPGLRHPRRALRRDLHARTRPASRAPPRSSTASAPFSPAATSTATASTSSRSAIRSRTSRARSSAPSVRSPFSISTATAMCSGSRTTSTPRAPKPPTSSAARSSPPTSTPTASTISPSARPDEDLGPIDQAGLLHVLYGEAGAGLGNSRDQIWLQTLDPSEDDDRFTGALAAGHFSGHSGADLAIGAPGETFGGLTATGARQPPVLAGPLPRRLRVRELGRVGPHPLAPSTALPCESPPLPVHSQGMALAPHFVADVLQRQGLISAAQAEEIKKEARQLPSRAKAPSTYEQKAVAYDLVGSLRFPSLRDPSGHDRRAGDRPGHRRRFQSGVGADRHALARRRPHRVQDLAAVRQAPPDDSAVDDQRPAQGRLRQSVRHRGHRRLPAHRRPRPPARRRLRARHPARDHRVLRPAPLGEARRARPLGRHRSRQPRAARPDEERVRDRVERPAHRQRRRVHAAARLRHAGLRHPRRAQARLSR